MKHLRVFVEKRAIAVVADLGVAEKIIRFVRGVIPRLFGNAVAERRMKGGFSVISASSWLVISIEEQVDQSRVHRANSHHTDVAII